MKETRSTQCTGNELYNVLDKDPCPPMTFQELRERLKHIAVLCTGLSIDLANEIQMREDLTEENERLKNELKAERTARAQPKRKPSASSYSKRSAAMRAAWAKRKALTESAIDSTQRAEK